MKKQIITAVVCIVIMLGMLALYHNYVSKQVKELMDIETAISLGNAQCQTSIQKELNVLDVTLKEKGEITLFNKVLVEKQKEVKE